MSVERLKFCVLERAIQDALDNRLAVRHPHLRTEALVWIRGEYPLKTRADEVMSYSGICESLNIDRHALYAFIESALIGDVDVPRSLLSGSLWPYGDDQRSSSSGPDITQYELPASLLRSGLLSSIGGGVKEAQSDARDAYRCDGPRGAGRARRAARGVR